jgi:hypothetical protein
MPQLSIETFVSQYFWLVLIFFSLYYLLITKFIPLISEAYKARTGFDEVGNKNTHSKTKSLESSLIKEISGLHFNVPATNLTYNSHFSKNILSWSNKVKGK